MSRRRTVAMQLAMRGLPLLLVSCSASTITSMLAEMSLEDKVGQMTQLDIAEVLANDCPVRLDQIKLKDVLSSQRLGSFFNSPFTGGPRCGRSGWTASEWRAVIAQIQAEAKAQGLPPLLFGIDSVHGANYVQGATVLPQQLGLAASFDEHLAQRVAMLTAKDSRAANLQWIFAPILGVMVHPMWPRVRPHP